MNLVIFLIKLYSSIIILVGGDNEPRNELTPPHRPIPIKYIVLDMFHVYAPPFVFPFTIIEL